MTPAPPFTECDAILDDRPVRQGDVLEWASPRPPFETTIGIVITADCDIEKRKTHGILNYVPVLPLELYLRRFVLPEKHQKALDWALPEVTRRASNLRRVRQPDAEQFSNDVMQTWLGCDTSDSIVEALDPPSDARRDEFIALADDTRKLLNINESTPLGDCVGCVAAIRVHQSQKNKLDGPTAIAKLWAELGDKIRDLPGDAFFLSRLGDPSPTAGHVVHLRIIREIELGNVAIRQSDLGRGPDVAKRIARLRSPFIYGLTRRLSDVFASIGLPRDYETERDRIVKDLG